MKTETLKTIYAKINGSILLAQAYLEAPEFSFIVKSCRLKPLKYMEDKTDKIIFYKQWIDEYGNLLKIIKNKRIIMSYNDLSIDRSKLICTDPFYGLTIKNVAKISKLAYMMIGKDETLLQDCCLISFIGIDDYLRTYLYIYDQWHKVSPLLWGIKHLKIITNFRDIKYFKTFSIKENIRIPCASVDTWLTYMPANRDFIELLEKKNGSIFANLFKKDK